MEDNEVKYISLSKAAKLSEYSQEYISLLCRTKKMKGIKLGRNWVTTAEWVREYIDRTNGKGEMVVPVRVEAKYVSQRMKDKEKISKEGGFISLRPHFMALNDITLFTLFFGLSIFAFVIFQEMLILKAIR